MRSARFLIGVCSIVFCGAVAAPRTSPKQSTTAAAKPTPLILEKDQGEKRLWRPVEGSKFGPSAFLLKIDPKNGDSRHFVMGTEDLAPGGEIDMHKHLGQDEILFLENGRAHVTLGGQEQDAHGGATIFIPQGTWISLKNTGAEPIGMVFVFSHPGFENYMRCTSVPYGQRATPMSSKEDEACQAKGHVMYK